MKHTLTDAGAGLSSAPVSFSAKTGAVIVPHNLLLGSNPRVMTRRGTRSIYARCCAQAVVNGTAEHGWGRRTANLKNRSSLHWLLLTFSL